MTRRDQPTGRRAEPRWLAGAGGGTSRVLARAIAALPTLVALLVTVLTWRAADVASIGLGASFLGEPAYGSLAADPTMAVLVALLAAVLVVADRHVARVRGGELVDDRIVAAVGAAGPLSLLLVADLAVTVGLATWLVGSWWFFFVFLLAVLPGSWCMNAATWLLPGRPARRPLLELSDAEVATFRHERPRPPPGVVVISGLVAGVLFLIVGPVGIAIGTTLPWLLGWERPTVVVNRHGLLVHVRRRRHVLPWGRVLDVRAALDRPPRFLRSTRWWGRPASRGRRIDVLEVVLRDGTRRYVVCRDAAVAAALARSMLGRAESAAELRETPADPPLVEVLPAPSLVQRLRGERPVRYPDAPHVQWPAM